MSTAPGTGLSWRYAKTEAGRAEIRQRALPLSRPARNLLLIIDPSRSGQDWLAMVQGCSAAELQALLDAALVAPRMSLAQALETKGLATLRDRVIAQAAPLSGRAAAGRLAAEAQRCNDPVVMRALAQRFVEQVREADGDGAAVVLAQVLLAPD